MLPHLVSMPLRCCMKAHKCAAVPSLPCSTTDRMVLKTCGTTKLLSCVPYMCQLAEGLGMAPARVK